MTTKPQAHNRGSGAAFKANEDGSIDNEKVERYLLLLVDGVPTPDAWVQVGYNQKGGSYSVWRKSIEAHPVFKARMAELLTEKSRCESDPVFGDARWAALQLWRTARAKEDLSVMSKAADILFKISEREAAQQAPAPQEGVQRGPGKPAIDNPQAAQAASEIRQRLLAKGITMAEPTADEVNPDSIS